MNTRLLSITFLLFTSYLIIAQELPKIIPPSPDAQAMANYAYFPPATSNGAISTSVPIYTIKSGDITYPISLNYHHSGIKVAQDASWVGLGHALQGIGIITRVINGKEDDFHSTGYYFVDQSNIPDEFAWKTSNFEPFCSPPDPVYISLWNTLRNTYDNYDTEADIFYYNFNGKTGTFYFNKKTTNATYAVPIIQSASPLDIKYYYDQERWEITDELGFKYTFGTQEITMPCNQQTSGATGSHWNHNAVVPTGSDTVKTSSWYLDKIESPLKNEINFLYDTETQATKSSLQLSENHSYTISTASGLPGGFSFSPPPPPLGVKYNYNAFLTVTENVYLKKILFKNGYIDFQTSPRNDLETYQGYGLDWITLGAQTSPAQKLDRITVRNNNDSKILDCQFNYSNFQGSSFKLRLDSLVFNNIYNNPEEKYYFDYYNDTLPPVTSNAIDHWGYYNGNENIKRWSSDVNASLNAFGTRLPSTSFFNYDQQMSTTEFYGKSREADPDKAIYGSLKSIIYPISGKKTFIYESNTYVDQVNTTSDFHEEVRVSSDIDGFTTKQISFTLNETTDVAIEYSSLFKINTSRLTLSNNNEECFTFPETTFARINDGSSNIQYFTSNSYDFSVDDSHCEPGGSSIIAGYWNMTNIKNITLPAGSYTAIVETLNFGNNESIKETKLEISYSYGLQAGVDQQFNGGGIRIKEIVNNTGNEEIRKQYNYDIDGVSSGKLMSPIQYYYPRFQGLLLYDGTTGNASSGTVCSFGKIFVNINQYTANSSGIYNLGASPSGNGVSYGKVTEVTVSDTDSFSTDFWYNVSTNVHRYPNIPATYSTRNGSLEKVEHRNNNGVVVKRDTYSYAYTKLGEVESLKIIPSVSGYPLTSTGVFEWYQYNSEWLRLNEKTEELFDVNGQNPIVTTSNYFYENPTHLQMTRSTTTQSNGDVLTSKNFFPDDVLNMGTLAGNILSPNEFSEVQRLKKNNLHRIATPIQTENYVNDNLKSIQRTNYKYWFNSLSQPETIETLKGTYNSSSNSLDNRIQIHAYDTDGNIVEVSKKDGAHIVYLWGYNKSLPIAKVENANYSQVSSYVSNIESMSNLDDDTCLDSGTCDEKNLRTALADLRNISGAMVTTYTYDPLIGITSVTDPKGYTMYYEYDDFNRLEHVKDVNGNILSKNEYKYKQ